MLFGCILIRFIRTAVLSLLYPKQNEIALIYHGKITIIDCRVPIVKIFCRTLQRFILFAYKPIRRLSQLLIKWKTKHSFDIELRVSVSCFGYKVIAQIIKITSAAKQKNSRAVLYRLVNFYSRSRYKVIRYIHVGMPEARTSLFSC